MCSSINAFDRRIDSLAKVRPPVSVWQTHRNSLNAHVNRQSTAKDVRVKLRRLYPTLEG
jgi:hypothetical protein